MALHLVNLPKSAAHLFRVIALQKKLLKALADPALNANEVNTAWVKNVWGTMDPEWVRKFCLDGQEGRIQAIAAATPGARQSIYEEFSRQNKVQTLLNEGGNFQDLLALPHVDAELASQVKEFFKRCYKRLSHNVDWPGYTFPGNRTITNRSYKNDFCAGYPTSVVCPYCDGEIGTPELDHYLSKSDFPLIACSPWNLVPICGSCNDVITGKGARPAITLGPPRSTADWLHPFFRPASAQVQIKLNGSPKNSIPQLYSPDVAEQTRLTHHTELVPSMSTRWTRLAAAHFDVLVREVNKKMRSNPARTIGEIVGEKLGDHLDSHGKAGSSMIHAAVCHAVLDQRPEYLEEFATPNAPTLV